MIFTKTFKFQLCPNHAKEEKCAQFAGASRWIYNRGLAQRNQLWKEEKRSITLFAQNNELVHLKQEEATSWLKEVHSQVLQQALDDLNKAFERFFQGIKNKENVGYPGFRCKGEHDSFRYPQGVKVKDNLAWLPKIGWVKFRKSREIEGKIKQTTVIKEAGHWYVCFACEIEKEVHSSENRDIIGIDVGLEHFATIATDQGIQEIASPRFFRKQLTRIRYLSKQVSKKEKKSTTRLKAKVKLSRKHAQIRNQRKDWLHKLSTQIVKSHGKIVVESLKIKDLLQKGLRYLARAISDVGWREFLQMLKYKSVEMGKVLIEARAYFPSTKRCFYCHTIHEMPLSKREYNCGCGNRMHRDHNAALNLKAAGMSV